MADGKPWIRCTGKVTNNTDEDIGRYDIHMKHTRRYKDEYGETVEENNWFNANDVKWTFAGSGRQKIFENRYGYPNYETYYGNFVDLRAHESVDFDFVISPNKYDLEGDDVEFVDPTFEPEVYEYGQARVQYEDYLKGLYLCDSLHDFDVEVIGGPDTTDISLKVTNNTGKYLKKVDVYCVYLDDEGDYWTLTPTASYMKPGETIEITQDSFHHSREPGTTTFKNVTHVVYCVDESK